MSHSCPECGMACHCSGDIEDHDTGEEYVGSCTCCFEDRRDPEEDDNDCEAGNIMEDEDYKIEFAEPGGRSSLRASSASNPRNLPCPTCGTENVLTPKDRAAGYQCNRCADSLEGFAP